MGQIFGAVCFVACVAAIFVNATAMLVSPEVWFRMPAWIRLNGTLTRAKYAKGQGAVQIRLLGAIFLGLLAYMFHAVFAAHR